MRRCTIFVEEDGVSWARPDEVGERVAEFQAEEKVTEPQGGETVAETPVEVKIEEPQEDKDFLEFINDTNSDLKSIPGIGKTP